MRSLFVLVLLLGCQDPPAGSAVAPASAPIAATLPAEVPAVTAVLSAENTMAFAALENLDTLGAEVERMLGAFPPGMLEGAPPAITDAAARRAFLGFDSTRLEGWAEVGLDAAGGVAAAWDRRLDRPLLFLKINDEAKLRAALARFDVKVELSGEGPIRRGSIAGQAALVARRGAWTLVVLDAVDADIAGLPALTVDDAPLSGVVGTSFADGVKPLWISAWLSSKAAAAFRAADGPKGDLQSALFFAERFPHLAFALGKGDGVLRIEAAPAGLAALKKMFVLASPPPAFSKNFSESMALRFDINFATFLDGLGELIPPSEQEAQVSLNQLRGALPLVVGFTPEELGAAFTGHGLIQLAPVGPTRPVPAAALALAIRDVGKADELLDRGVKLAANRSEIPAEPISVAGHNGFSFSMPPSTVVVLRAQNLLWIGDKDTVQSALTKPRTMGAAAARLDQPAALALVLSLDSFNHAFPLGPEEHAIFQAGLEIWKPYLTEGWVVSNARIDERGIRIGEGPAGAALPGVLAAVAVPAFLRYMQNARALEPQ